MQVKRFLPFLSGNRSCIGMSLAQLNYTIAVATLLSRFSFRLADDVSTAVTLAQVHAAWMPYTKGKKGCRYIMPTYRLSELQHCAAFLLSKWAQYCPNRCERPIDVLLLKLLLKIK